ncbi:hypothetical protein H5410_064860 [Solanum commersonii]|uniref:Uncharacterized protein n=1 Tax=Solanum commersonii TaxID=4109 RepID=A0A9J5VY62_SOLCO|nr:hypothetical protein H5410_064860 [Solanum commersonii]
MSGPSFSLQLDVNTPEVNVETQAYLIVGGEILDNVGGGTLVDLEKKGMTPMIPRVTDLFGKLERFLDLKEEEDSLTWIGRTKVVFSVKTAYNYLTDLEQFNNP